jgi:hypothetical protein
MLAGALVVLSFACASAQDSSSSASGQSTESGTGLNVQRGNPLSGLFTPQPQYPTPQTIFNPEPKAPRPGELNPLKGLFTPQPQYPTAQTIRNGDGEPALGEVNHLKSVFTPPNQYATAQTVLNPQAVPRHFVPERQLLWGSEDVRNDLIKQHNLNTFGVEDPLLNPVPKNIGVLPGQTDVKPGGVTNGGKSEPGQGGKSSVSFHGSTTTTETIFDETRKAKREQLRDVLKMMAAKNNSAALKALAPMLKDDPENAQIHYLKAVALVNLHRYEEGGREYKTVLERSSSDQLSRLARVGLAKIGQ